MKNVMCPKCGEGKMGVVVSVRESREAVVEDGVLSFGPTICTLGGSMESKYDYVDLTCSKCLHQERVAKKPRKFSAHFEVTLSQGVDVKGLYADLEEALKRFGVDKVVLTEKKQEAPHVEELQTRFWRRRKRLRTSRKMSVLLPTPHQVLERSGRSVSAAP